MQFMAVVKSRKPSGFMIYSSDSAHETFRSTHGVLIYFVIIYEVEVFSIIIIFHKIYAIQ